MWKAVAVSCALIGWLFVSSARADLSLLESFDYPNGKLDAQGEAEVNGWAGPWNSEGLVVRDGAVVGRGHASRAMIPTVDFALDDEWYFRVGLERTGVSQGSDYCVISLANRDRSVDRKPFYMGINSREKFYAMAGIGEAQLFGEYDPRQAYVLIARLKTRVKGHDELRVWVFPANRPLPVKPLTRPSLVMAFDYSGNSKTLELRTGGAEGYQARFDDIRAGESWSEITAQSPETFRFDHPYRKFRFIRVADNGVHMLPNSWSKISVIPWDDDRPQIIQMSSWPWIPDQDRIYTIVDGATRRYARPEPDPEIPLYDTGRSFDELPYGWYQTVPRPGGGFDLIDRDTAALIPMTDGRPRLQATYKTLDVAITGDNKHTYVADVDGDGVVDLLLSRLRESKWNYWPEGRSPWKRPRQSLMGPDRDPDVNENIRGYDVAGNWLGGPITYELLWAKGRREGGRLRFGELSPVYYGRDDFPLLWRNYSQKMACAVIERGAERYMVLLSAANQLLALPVLESDEGQLHTGRAEKLLAPDADPYSLNMDNIYGVVDLDGDGLTELVVGSGSSGFVTVIKGKEVGQFRTHVLQMVGGPMAAATLTVPTCGDWDNDGYDDLILADGQGLFTFFPGTENPLVYSGGHTLTDADGRVIKRYGNRNIQGPQEVAWGYTQAQMFDWDRDGQLDLITNDNTATFRLFKRIDANDPSKVDPTMAFTFNGHKLPVAWRSRPTAIPGGYGVAGDDRPVLLYEDVDQILAFGIPMEAGSMEIERIEHPTYVGGGPIRLSYWGGLSGRSTFSVVDWDEDGRWDVLFSSQSANLSTFYEHKEELRQNAYIASHSPFWLRNVGTNSGPMFERARRIRHADGSVIRAETHAGNVCPADLDGDGRRLDLIYGDGPGFVYYFMNNELSWSELPGR
jgi:FG-GAP-like repeat